MFNKITKLTWMIRLFGLSKVAMVAYCRPSVVSFDEDILEIKIPIRRRTRNHLSSMYFGALSVGADITCGFLALPAIKNSNRKIALIFKDFNAKFLKRAESDVHFVCEDGKAVKNLVEKAIQTQERENFKLKIFATCPKISEDIVAKFELTLSLKDYTNR